MANFLILLVVAVIVGCAAGYVRKKKKAGVHCIGCPDSGTCAGKCAGCSCGCSN